MVSRVRELRKKRGLNQKALGDAIGVSQQTVSRIENDIYSTELDLFIKLARFFGVTMEYLAGVSDVPRSPEMEISIRRELDENQEFIIEFCKLKESSREVVRQLVDNMVGIQGEL